MASEDQDLAALKARAQELLDSLRRDDDGPERFVAAAEGLIRDLLAAVERLEQPLRERVEGEHDDATHWPKGSTRGGHAGTWTECPHPLCRLLATPDAP
jgi:hypothetical protein